MARSHRAKFVAALKQMPHEKASLERLAAAHAARPTAPAAWTTVIGARQRDRTAAEQEDFFRRGALGPTSFLGEP